MSAHPNAVAYNPYFKKELTTTMIYGDKIIYRDLLTPFAKLLRNRIKQQYQNTILVSGRTGSGKSTLAIQLCKAIDPKWDLESNYIYSSEDLKRKLRNRGDSSPISLLDEGSVSLNSYNSQKTDDQRLTVLMDTCRSLGWTTVICIPNKDDLNKRIRNNHLDFMLRCPSQSVIPGYNPRGFYNLYTHEYRDWGKDYWMNVGCSIYDKLDKDVQTDYNKIKLRHQMELIDKFTEEDDE